MTKRTFLALALAVVTVCCTVPFAVSAADGTAISTTAELVTLMGDSSKWGGTYYLANDIDLSASTVQTPIGNGETRFTGVFDGNGKTISGLSLSGEKYQALFGAAENATIKNLTVKGSVEDISTAGTEMYTAGIVGALSGNSLLENVTSYVNVKAVGIASAQAVGGIAGKAGCVADNDVLTIKNCHGYGTVEAGRGAGSLIGILSANGVETTTNIISGGKINVTGCSGSGTVTYNSGSAYAQAGGMIGNIFGYLAQGFEINVTDCISNSELTGPTLKSRAGGLIGWISCDKNTAANTAGGTVNITNCENTANVSAATYCGGIAGYITMLYRNDYAVNIKNCVNRGTVYTSGSYAGGIVGTAKGAKVTLTQCANYGAITADEKQAGGIVGTGDLASSTGILEFIITDCANYGVVTAFTEAAGIMSAGGATVTLERVYNGGKLVTIDLLGAKGALTTSLTGTLTVNGSYYINTDTDANGTAIAAADAGKTATFSGWNFGDVWAVENSMPVLKFLSTGTTAPVTTTAPETTAAPVTTKAAETTKAPETTKPAEGTSAPATNDTFMFVFAAAVIAAAACILIVRRKERV